MQLMLDDRFWTKVDRANPSGCWVWLASRNNKGYGMFRPGGMAPKALAHRLSFAEVNGPIPRGSLILHSCDNPACVNPSHLREGTHKDNAEDMDKRGRRRTNDLYGERVGTSKLTALDVIAIRQAYISGDDLAGIASRFGCAVSSLVDYTSGRSWRHLLGQDNCPTLSDLKKEGARRRRNGAKIDIKQASEIRLALASGETGRSIALRYGLHYATISDIKTGKIWRT